MDQAGRAYQSKIPRVNMARKRRRKRNSGGKTFLILCLLAIPFLFVILYKLQPQPSWLYPSLGVVVPPGYSVYGIDVSRYQGSINWSEVRSGEVDIQFAYIKATEGITIKSSKYPKQRKAARKMNIAAGAYHFFRPTVDAASQASYFLKFADLKSGDLPPVLDVEVLDGCTEKQLTQGVAVWIKAVKTACACEPVIYTSDHMYQKILKKAFPDSRFWIARYSNKKPKDFGKQEDVLFWQFSDRGQVNGIGQPVDLNVFVSDSTRLQTLRIP